MHEIQDIVSQNLNKIMKTFAKTLQCFGKRFHDFIKFWEKNITDFHANNLNNPSIPENVDNKDEDGLIITIKKDLLSNFNHFDGLFPIF